MNQPVQKLFTISWLLIAGLALLLSGHSYLLSATEEILPKKPDPDLLSSVWKSSPYQRGIASDSSSQYVLTGIFSIGSQDFVSVLNRTTSDRFTLNKTPDKKNSKLLDLHFSNNLKEAYATVEIEGTQYKIKYDQLLLAEVPALPIPTATQPTAATNNTNNVRPNNLPPWMTNSGQPRFFRRQRPIENPNSQ